MATLFEDSYVQHLADIAITKQILQKSSTLNTVLSLISWRRGCSLNIHLLHSFPGVV